MLADAVERSRRVLGEEHPQTGILMSLLTFTYLETDQPAKAEALGLSTLDIRRRVLGEAHSLTVNTMVFVARAYLHQQKYAEAEQLTRRVIELSRNLTIENSPFLSVGLSNLGRDYLDRHRLDLAETLCEMALSSLRRKPDANPQTAGQIIARMGEIRFAQKRYSEAETLLAESLNLMEKVHFDAGYRYRVMDLHGASMANQRKFAQAESLLLQSRQALLEREAQIPRYLNPARWISQSLEHLAQLYEGWGKPVQAAEWKQKLAEFQQATQEAEKKAPQP